MLEAHARNSEVEINNALNRIERLLSRIADAELKIRSDQNPKLASDLSYYKGEFPEVGTLLVADANGRIQNATTSTLIGHNISKQAYFATHQHQNGAARIFMSRPDNSLLNTTSVLFSIPIIDSQHRFHGIVAISIGFDFFPKLLQATNPDDSSDIFAIFNREGDLLYRNEESEKFFGNNIAAVSEIFKKHTQGAITETRHTGPSAYSDKIHLFIARKVGNTGLSLILSRQRDDVLARWKRNVIIYILIFFFAATVIISESFISSRRKRQVLVADQLIESASIMVVGMDTEGCVTLFNEAAEHISGYRRDEVLGKSWLALTMLSVISPEAKNAFQKFLLGDELPPNCDHSILTRSGQERIISWQSSVANEPRTAIYFGVDITERKRMEAELLNAKRLADEANHSKVRFLAAASHDLRQPIHAQSLFLDVLSHTELNPHQQTLLTNVSAANTACAEMLNTLLDFSRIEAGVIKPQVQAFSLQPLLNKIEREFAGQADGKGIAYRSRETAIAVQSDPALIELILRNLVSNAIRYTERGGLLVTCRKRGELALLEVRDTGIGINIDQQQNVFREFHQLGNPERARHKGLGLGLSITQGLARTLGHKLTLTSTPNKGSIFSLTLPIATIPPNKTQTIAENNPARILNARILVIEDDTAVLSGMLYVLDAWGCECIGAESTEEAIMLAQEQTPDLIISDYRLHEQHTGLEAIMSLREALGIELPALLITGDTAPDRLREALAGGIPLLHKPVNPQLLFNAIIASLPSSRLLKQLTACEHQPAQTSRNTH